MNKKEELIISTTFLKLGLDQNSIHADSNSDLIFYYDIFYDGILEFLISQSKDKIRLKKSDLPPRLRRKWKSIFPKAFHDKEFIFIDRSNEDIDNLIITFSTFEKIWNCEIQQLHLKVKSNVAFFNQYWVLEDFRIEGLDLKLKMKNQVLQVQNTSDFSVTKKPLSLLSDPEDYYQLTKIASETELDLALYNIIKSHFTDNDIYISMTLGTILKSTDNLVTYVNVNNG